MLESFSVGVVMSAGPREYDCSDMPQRKEYMCLESNRDVKSVIYFNGNAKTHGELVSLINELIKENQELRRQRAMLVDKMVDRKCAMCHGKGSVCGPSDSGWCDCPACGGKGS